MIVCLCLLLLDAVLLTVVFFLAFLVKFGGDIPEYCFSAFKGSYHALTLIYILAFLYVGVFRNRFKSYWDLFKCIFAGLFLGAMLGMSLIYVFRERWMGFPSSIFPLASTIGLFVIFSCNALILRLLGRICKRVLIIGEEADFNRLHESRLHKCYHLERIEDIMHYDNVDEIVVCQSFMDEKQMNMLLFLLLKLKVNVLFSPGLYAKLISESILEESSIEYLATFVGRRSDSEEFLIRAVDVIGSIALLVFVSPLFIIIPVLIKVTSRGSIFYKQTRMAKDGQLFTLLKFRTMIENAEEHTGPVLAYEGDPRMIPIGSFLRKTRLDELPQLVNVLLGRLSLVGPRPERPHFVKRHKVLREIRLAVKPGLTGLAQVRGIYGLPPEQKMKYDYLYIQKRSLLLNLYILMKTIPVILSRKGT